MITALWPLWAALVITGVICVVESWPDIIRSTRRTAYRRTTKPVIRWALYLLPWV